VITQKPNGDKGKMWASRAAAGRNGRFRLHVCVDWMVPPLGSWAVMPGIAARLFVKGASVVMSEVSSRAGVEDGRGFLRGGSII
jgi:hypothetical protein